MKKEITPPRPASTVILLREDGAELQIYLLRRSQKSSFMAGNYVFPGGVLDPPDREFAFWKEHIDLDENGLKGLTDETFLIETALAHGVAAIRETFEEAGVLLLKHPPIPDLENLQAQRKAGRLAPGWLKEGAANEGWILDFSGLKGWSHWITPEARSHRYDARFFLTFMPENQACAPDNTETTHGIWISPAGALAGNLRGEIPLSPPAIATLHELLSYRQASDIKKALQDRGWGAPRLPVFQRFESAAVILLAGDPAYATGLKGALTGAAAEPLPVGKPFSRIWCEAGVWRPVAA